MNKYWCGGAMAVLLTGCAHQASQDQSKSMPVAQLTGAWQVESIDQGGIIDGSNVTMTFGEDGQVYGMAGCNRYSATMNADNDTITVSHPTSTRMACPPAIMKQEKRFLSALSDAAQWRRVADTWLVADDEQGKPRIKMISLNPAASATTEQAAGATRQYSCGNAGQLSVRPVSYEVVELSVADQMLILSQVPTASGAKYGEGDLSLWEQGDSAMFESGGRRFECQAVN